MKYFVTSFSLQILQLTKKIMDERQPPKDKKTFLSKLDLGFLICIAVREGIKNAVDLEKD